MVPELDPYYAEHAQPLTTAGEELDDLDHDLSDLSVRGVQYYALDTFVVHADSSVSGLALASWLFGATDFFSFFFFIPFFNFGLLFPLSLFVVTQIRGHVAGSSPLPIYGSCLALLSREDVSPSFPRRLAPICAYLR